jgi:hypothetical protein
MTGSIRQVLASASSVKPKYLCNVAILSLQPSTEVTVIDACVNYFQCDSVIKIKIVKTVISYAERRMIDPIHKPLF